MAELNSSEVRAGQLWRHKLNGTVIEILTPSTAYGAARYRTRGVIPPRAGNIYVADLPRIYTLLEDPDA